jgi:hypothetical protein
MFTIEGSVLSIAVLKENCKRFCKKNKKRPAKSIAGLLQTLQSTHYFLG